MSRQADFKKLKKQWYAKLSQETSDEYPEGFVDIERDEYTLKSPTAKFFKRRHGLVISGRWKANLEYYLMASHFLNTYTFDKKRDEIIWEYHSLGISVRNIADLINELGVFKTNRTCVHHSIKKTKNLMYRAAALDRADETNEQ